MNAFILITAFLIGISAASAEVRWVGTPFWQTPIETDVQTEMTGASSELKDACAEFEKFIFEASSDREYQKDILELYRSLPLTSSMSLRFSHSMKLSAKYRSNVKTGNLSDLVQTASKKDQLPNFSYEASEVILQDIGDPVVVSGAQSLLAVARSLGLSDEAVQLKSRPDGFYVEFSGKDAVCDLLAGRAHLQSKAKVAGRITLEEQLRISSLYGAISDITNKILKQNSSQVRAALLGFRLGGHLASQKDVSTAQAEKQMLAVLEKFFVQEKMQPNHFWQNLPGGEKTFSVDGISNEIDADLKIFFKE